MPQTLILRQVENSSIHALVFLKISILLMNVNWSPKNRNTQICEDHVLNAARVIIVIIHHNQIHFVARIWIMAGVISWCSIPLQKSTKRFINAKCGQNHFHSTMRIIMTIMNVLGTQINEPRHDKTNNVAVRPAKTQISLGIRPV